MPEIAGQENDSSPGLRTTGAVLLAAGKSERMGRPKPLLEWQGRPLLAYQIRELQAAGLGAIVVVLGHRGEELLPLAEEAADPARTRAIINPHHDRGKTTSIRTGILSLAGDLEALLVLGVDQPRPASLLRELVEIHFRGGAPITIPAHAGRRGHPAVFDRALVPELLTLSEERQGAREVIDRHRDRTAVVQLDAAVVLLDLNTPEDYRRALGHR